MKFGFSDVVYTLHKASARAEKILTRLAEAGIYDLRFGLNLVSVPSRNPLGDIRRLMDTFLWLNSKGFRLHLYLFLSDDIANAGQGDCPAPWREDSPEELAQRLKNDCLECIGRFRENGIEISSYTVGNESEWGVCGYRLEDKVSREGMENDESFEWLGKNLWQPAAVILKACCQAIKEHSPHSTVLVHSDSVGKKSFTYEYFKYLHRQEVAFDAIGLTYNPWTLWDEDYDHFAKISRTVGELKAFGKPIWMVEYCYPNQMVSNGELTSLPPGERYPYTPDGQTRFHLDFIEFCKRHTIDTLFFWRGEHEQKEDISNELGIFQNGGLDPQLLEVVLQK